MSEKRRDVFKVRHAILLVIPDDAIRGKVWKMTFHEFDEVNHLAPEQLWNALVSSLTVGLGEPDAPWKMIVQEIISGKRDYQEFLGR